MENGRGGEQRCQRLERRRREKPSDLSKRRMSRELGCCLSVAAGASF